MRKICVYTATRAEYGILYNLLKEIDDDSNLELVLIVSGSHLEKNHGMTVKRIKEDGFKIFKEIKIYNEDFSSKGLLKSMAKSLDSLSEVFAKNKPDIGVVLGDRYEIHTFAQACMMFNVPLAHIHGGEATEGLIDDVVRHSVTKMAHIHFPSTEVYKNRIIQMGEIPKNVFNFGAPGVDSIKNLNLLDRGLLFEELGVPDRGTFMVTYHPVTLYPEKSKSEFNALLNAIEDMLIDSTFNFVFSMPNIENGSEWVAEELKAFCKSHESAYLFSSLGQQKYFSLIKQSLGVVGNSSSGIIEVPYFKKPTINIGERQKGRVSGKSVIHVSDNKNEILEALKKCLDEVFIKSIQKEESLYGCGGASEKIKNVLKEINLEGILYKPFWGPK